MPCLLPLVALLLAFFPEPVIMETTARGCPSRSSPCRRPTAAIPPRKLLATLQALITITQVNF